MTALDLSYGWASDKMLCRGIFDADGTKLEPCDDYAPGLCPPVVRLETGEMNIVPIQTLLRAAGITNLDTFGDFDCDPGSPPAPGCESARYAGLVLQVGLEYDNRFSFDTTRVQYRYTVQHVTEAEYKADEILYDPTDETTRTKNNRHGIRLVFRQVGNIGTFDVQVLLVNMVAAMALLAVATTIVDNLMLYVLPQKVRRS